MIQFYPKYKQFKAWVDAKDYENAVRIGLSSLRSTSGAETSWLRLMKSRRLHT